jgi:hypothetical protein
MKKFIEIIKNLFTSDLQMKKHTHFFNFIEESDLEKFKNEFENKSIKTNVAVANALFEEACYGSQVDIVEYMLTSPNTQIFHNLPFYKTEWIEESCREGKIEVINYIVNNPSLQNNKKFSNMINRGLSVSCAEGNLVLIKLFTSNSLIKYVEDLERNFLTYINCNSNKTEILKYFIFDLNIKKNNEITQYFNQLKSWDKIRLEALESINMIEKMFKQRDMKEELNNELSNEKPRKNKINKI